MRWMLLLLVVGCGGKTKTSSSVIGAACDATVSSQEPPDCAAPLVCTDAFGKGDVCTALLFNGCPAGTQPHDAATRLLVCMPKCGAASCMDGWTCQSDGTCAPN